MFFLFAKILGFFALPSNLFISFGLIGIALMATRYAGAGRKLALASLLLIDDLPTGGLNRSRDVRITGR